MTSESKTWFHCIVESPGDKSRMKDMIAPAVLDFHHQVMNRCSCCWLAACDDDGPSHSQKL
jgi:hypothetical protein